MTSRAESWTDRNQSYLAGELDRIRALLDGHLTGDVPAKPKGETPADTGELYPPPALVHLAARFGLSSFERDILLLCAGVELDAAVAKQCADAQGGSPTAPTFSLTLAALPEAHWSALAPAAPLRYWRLIELGDGATLTRRPLHIDERVLHFLTGVGSLDDRLHGIVEALAPGGDLPPSHRRVAEQVVEAWQAPDEGPRLVHLCGDDRWGKRVVASAACEAIGFGLHLLRAADVPHTVDDREALVRLWGREAALELGALLVEVADDDPPEVIRAAMSFVERVHGPLLMASREALPGGVRPSLRLDVNRPTSDEQLALWRDALGDAAPRLNGHLGRLVAQFRLGARDIRVAGAVARHAGSDVHEVAAAAWKACRLQSRPRLDDLAQRLDTAAGWEDLVLPISEKDTLREITFHVRQRTRVYEEWGFATRGARGLGVSALFSGASGTGKTLAAEVMANELSLDLYRIDLSQVVSKYIGETEKNLRRVFDAAEEGGVVLLFDEADALFGKRSEVKDSHDRYANIEVSYLLQRMEAYRGLAILTTNLKKSLDTAFLRRLRFIVHFPFPDATQRAEIWRRTVPSATPTRELDFDRLAQLNVAGGNIRNIALSAAFLAAEAEESVGMSHLLQAARGEYAKLERPLGASEIAGWV